MIELTQEQRQELSRPEPRAFDPATRQTYVLVRADRYEALKALLAADTVCATAEALDRTMGEDDAADPYLAALQAKYAGGRP
jgi:predicted outer membrane protein